MEEIIGIIKDMDTSKELNSDLNRLLYRAMDKLVELKCGLLQLQVSKLSSRTQ